MVTTPGASGMSHVCTEETLQPFSASTPALCTRPDKDPLFKAGAEEHWASIPLRVHTHTCTDTHTHAQWAGLIRFNYTPQLGVITCDAPLTLLLYILAFSFTFTSFTRESEGTLYTPTYTVHYIMTFSTANTRGAHSNGNTCAIESKITTNWINAQKVHYYLLRKCCMMSIKISQREVWLTQKVI